MLSRYAELNGDTRSFTPEEEDLFDRSAEFAYASFRDKAAESHAQGRAAAACSGASLEWQKGSAEWLD